LGLYQEVIDGFELIFLFRRVAVLIDGRAADDDGRREQLETRRPLLNGRVPLAVEPGLAFGI